VALQVAEEKELSNEKEILVHVALQRNPTLSDVMLLALWR
jgi:hypothetical protein